MPAEVVELIGTANQLAQLGSEDDVTVTHPSPTPDATDSVTGAYTATPVGAFAPSMKFCLTPVPFRFARPIAFEPSLVQ